jgi:hypothetical protein
VKNAKAITIATAATHATSSQNSVVDDIAGGKLAKPVLLEVEAQAKVAIEQKNSFEKDILGLQRQPSQNEVRKLIAP